MEFKLRVRYYANLRESLKTSEEEITILLPTTEKKILEVLLLIHPKYSEILKASRIAIDENYVETNTIIRMIHVIDIISPISGG